MTALSSAGAQPVSTSEIGSGSSDDHLRIGEIARSYGITLRTLRFYEDKGLLTPQRDGTTRLYSKKDIARLRLILLGRKVGFSLREVKQMMDLYDPAGTNTKQLRVALDKGERQLGRLEKQRQLVEESITELRGAMDVVRKKLAERLPTASNLTN
ncbi:MAG: MerR family DNA-binding transcriptional regulator [Rhizobiaceae bacterium]